MKTVLITGASCGIGAAMARAFACVGYCVAIHYGKSAQQAQKLLADIQKQGGRAMLVQAEITDRASVFAAVKEVEQSFGAVEVLINNAGIAEQKLFTDLTEEEWKWMLDVHVHGAFHATQAVLPAMIRKKTGCILNISSIWGVSGSSCEVHYSTAKAALIGMTKALAKEVGPSGIRVNCIAPGVIQTAMNTHLPEDVMQQLQEEISLCRIGSVEDIAKTALYFASDAAEFVTGQVLVVDGGMI